MFAKLHSVEQITKFVRKDERLPVLQRWKSAVQDVMAFFQTIPIVINLRLNQPPPLLVLPAAEATLLAMALTNTVVPQATAMKERYTLTEFV
jgi:hypothetical protein